jgi:hypothetical protein
MIGRAMTTPSFPRELAVDRLQVQIFPNRTAMGVAAGTAAAEEISKVISIQGSARVILASAPYPD